MTKYLPLALCIALGACAVQPVPNVPQAAYDAPGRPEHPSAWLYRELAREQAVRRWELEANRRRRAAKLSDNYKWRNGDEY